jgi:hypothetical protein
MRNIFAVRQKSRFVRQQAFTLILCIGVDSTPRHRVPIYLCMLVVSNVELREYIYFWCQCSNSLVSGECDLYDLPVLYVWVYMWNTFIIARLRGDKGFLIVMEPCNGQFLIQIRSFISVVSVLCSIISGREIVKLLKLHIINWLKI